MFEPRLLGSTYNPERVRIADPPIEFPNGVRMGCDCKTCREQRAAEDPKQDAPPAST